MVPADTVLKSPSRSLHTGASGLASPLGQALQPESARVMSLECGETRFRGQMGGRRAL